MSDTFAPAEVCKVSGLPRRNLERWVRFQHVTPDENGNYNLRQLIAVTTATRYREAGAGMDRVAGVLEFLDSMPLELLERHLNEGRIMVVPGFVLHLENCSGVMLEVPKELPPDIRRLIRQKLNVELIRKEVLKKVKKLKRHSQLAATVR